MRNPELRGRIEDTYRKQQAAPVRKKRKGKKAKGGKREAFAFSGIMGK